MYTRTTLLKFVFQVFLTVVYVQLFTFVVRAYVSIFGDAYTSIEKLLFVFVCLIISMIIVFGINLIVRTNNVILGLLLGCGLFSYYYVFRNVERAFEVIYLTLISFPVNINMLSILLLPVLTGLALNKSLNTDAQKARAR